MSTPCRKTRNDIYWLLQAVFTLYWLLQITRGATYELPLAYVLDDEDVDCEV